MAVLLILIFASLGIALVFLFGFVWSVKSGQFDDTFTPSMRVLTEDQPPQELTVTSHRLPISSHQSPITKQ